MKRLILVRHGKSSWKYDLPDNHRPLKKRAYKDADLVISAFSGFFNPQAEVWSSFAVRALDSAKIFKEKLEIPDEKFQVRKELYTFDKRELLDVISSCDDSVEELMLFGHNPTITETANALGDETFENVPTTGLCVIDLDTDSWQKPEKGKTILYLFPKNLR